MKKIFLMLLGMLMAMAPTLAQAETQIQYLSGIDKDHTVPWEFYCTAGHNSGKWTTIPVPSCWELQGFGNYNFGREFWTYGSKFRFATEQGLYKYQFTVPADWKDREVWIVFEGSMTDTEVKINGKKAGDTHQGAFYEFRYNITDKLVFGGKNLLEVTVSKVSANNDVNLAERWADYWVFGGIFRPVYLASYPRQNIDHMALDARADGSFLVDVRTTGLTKPMALTATLSHEGKTVATFTGNAPAGDGVTRISGKVSAVRTWTAETPHMYKVEVALADGKKLVHKAQDVFGFRTIEVRRGKGIFLNGTQIRMKGVNRHEFWPESGRTLSRAVALQDIELVKAMNMNAIRCSHYPPDKRFLYLCDSLGIYVIDELAGWQNAYDTPVGSKLVKEMVERDVNHPSIMLWSNGNEGGHNRELDDDYALYDPSKRTVIHASYSFHKINGIDCNHYPNYSSVQRTLNDTMIYMCTEFLHCQDDGGGGAGLEDYWKLMWNSRMSGGGFLWALIDEAVVRTDQFNMLDAQVVHANDGVLGPHREKEGSYYAIREIFSPVQPGFKKLPAGFNGAIPVENQYFFTNLNQCTFHWKLVEYSKPGAMTIGHTILQEGSVKGPDVAPFGKGTLNLPLPASWKSADALMLSVSNPEGEELMTWSYRIRSNADLLAAVVKRAGTGQVAYSESSGGFGFGFGRPGGGAAPQAGAPGNPAAPAAAGNLAVRSAAPATPAPNPQADSLMTLRASGVSVTFSKNTGMITRAIGRFNNGPVMVSGTAKVREVKHYAQGDAHVIEFTYDGDLKYVKWTMYPSGWLEMDYAYTLNGKYDFTGISFNYPEKNVISMRWLGNGPYRVWKNRPQGAPFDVWSKMYNDTQTGSSPWAYPEFKGYHADMVWAELSTLEGRFIMASESENMFLRLFQFSSLGGVTQHPALPRGDISFLDHIPATGTKMATSINGQAPGYGPMGDINEVNGIFTRKLYFYFAYPDAPQ